MDSRLLGELIVAELDSVYRMAMYLSRDEHEARDLVQETYVKALAAAASYEPRSRGVKPWLFKILHNSFYTRTKQRQRLQPLPEEMPLEDVPRQQQHDLASMDWEQIDDRLKSAIEMLPPQYREVLLLWAVEDLKYREISEILDVALGTVMSRLYRARSILAENLKELAEEKGFTAIAQQRE